MMFYAFGFTILLEKWEKKEYDDAFLRKTSRRKTKQCYHNNICRWKRDSFSSEVKILRGIV